MKIKPLRSIQENILYLHVVGCKKGVNIALEQAMKAQRGSRDIAVLFL
jgi:hypothetical protein